MSKEVHIKRWVCDVIDCEDYGTEYVLEKRVADGNVVRLCSHHAKELGLLGENAPSLSFVNDTSGRMDEVWVVSNDTLWRSKTNFEKLNVRSGDG